MAPKNNSNRHGTSSSLMHLMFGFFIIYTFRDIAVRSEPVSNVYVIILCILTLWAFWYFLKGLLLCFSELNRSMNSITSGKQESAQLNSTNEHRTFRPFINLLFAIFMIYTIQDLAVRNASDLADVHKVIMLVFILWGILYFIQGLMLCCSGLIKSKKTVSPAKQENAQLSTEPKPVFIDTSLYLDTIQELNDLIPGDEISASIDGIKKWSGKIMSYAETHPEKQTQVDKFLRYYLPTTIKLMEQYLELHESELQTKRIITVMESIHNTLDSLIPSFEKLLESLMLNKVLDISSEMEVLRHR